MSKENVKKFQEELGKNESLRKEGVELLSEDELGQVSGGTLFVTNRACPECGGRIFFLDISYDSDLGNNYIYCHDCNRRWQTNLRFNVWERNNNFPLLY